MTWRLLHPRGWAVPPWARSRRRFPGRWRWLLPLPLSLFLSLSL